MATSKSQTKQYVAISKYNCFFLIVPVCKSKTSFLVMEYISSIIAVSARDSILMNIFNAKDFYCVLLMCIWGHFVIKSLSEKVNSARKLKFHTED